MKLFDSKELKQPSFKPLFVTIDGPSGWTLCGYFYKNWVDPSIIFNAMDLTTWRNCWSKILLSKVLWRKYLQGSLSGPSSQPSGRFFHTLVLPSLNIVCISIPVLSVWILIYIPLKLALDYSLPEGRGWLDLTLQCLMGGSRFCAQEIWLILCWPWIYHQKLAVHQDIIPSVNCFLLWL